MVQAISSFLEFCYLVRRSVLDDKDIALIEKAVADFHRDRVAFKEVRGPNRSDYSLPRQHSIVHYAYLIREFGAPNGLCSSITESKHIKAVKEPWRRSNKHDPLGQILLTNQRLDKLAALRIDLTAKGLLKDSLFFANGQCAAQPPERLLEPPPTAPLAEEDDDGGEVDGEVLGDVRLCNQPSECPSFST